MTSIHTHTHTRKYEQIMHTQRRKEKKGSRRGGGNDDDVLKLHVRPFGGYDSKADPRPRPDNLMN